MIESDAIRSANDACGPDRRALDWPFFDEGHRACAREIDAWLATRPLDAVDHRDVDAACRGLVRQLGAAGVFAHVAPGAYGGVREAIDSRTLCLMRETLAWRDGLADFTFAMQGLGSGAISLAGSHALKAQILPRVARGELIAAFALSEANAGSDVAAIACRASTDGDDYVLDGEKTWISNGGVADVYTVFARTGEAPGARGLSAFVVLADTPGLEIVERIEVMAPHPLARIRFRNCRVPRAHRLGEGGEGFKIAMRTLDIFRPSVAAAAIGFARRALDEALAHARSRRMFGGALADLQLTQAKLGEWRR